MERKRGNMPRHKQFRHFNPRGGVSQHMLDVEAQYIAREHQDYLTLSLGDMRQKLHELRGKWMEADQTAEMLVRCLPERNALAFQCLLVRDLFLVLAVYAACLKTARDSTGSEAIIPAPTPRSLPIDKTLPFSEWLFDASK
jgi:hypothetical protein